MKYTIYDKATGEVLYGGEAENPSSLLQPDQSIVLGELHTTGYFTGKKHVELPAKPDEYHTFNWSTHRWDDRRTTADLWLAVRIKRDNLLRNSDWIVLLAYENSQPVSPEWKQYRQALRDITLQQNPLGIQWPTKPE